MHASADRVWDALLTILTDFNYPIENMERASWFLRTQELTLTPSDAAAFADCGTINGHQLAGTSRFDVYVRLTFLLRPSGDSTAVRLQPVLRGLNEVMASLRASGNMFATDPNVQCVSRGKLESRLLEQLASRVAAH